MTSKKKFRKARILFLLPVLLILFLAGCEKPSISLGNSFINNNNTNIIVVDTISADLSTVLVDSFPTGSTNTMLIGTYKDPYFGVISSKSYFQMVPPATLPSISNQAGYDSMVLILRVNKNYYGDTTVDQTYSVSQLQTVIQLPVNQVTFYNNSRVPFDPNSPLGTTDARISPIAGYTSQKDADSLKIRMPDSKGLQLFNMLYTQSDTIKNFNTFIGFFKGLCVYPDETKQGAIYGFNDSVIMRLYYHEPGVSSSDKFVDFNFNDGSKQFNQITFDRSGTPTAPVTTIQNELPSTSTGNISFIQSATGLETKIRFPYLWKLPQRPDFISVLKAQLIIKPITGSYSTTFILPPTLNLFLTNQDNNIGGPIELNNVAQTGSLITDYLYGQNTSYTYDVTSYIQQQLFAGAQNNINNGLMLTLPPPQNSTTFNRAVIGDKFNLKNNNITLKLYYISFY